MDKVSVLLASSHVALRKSLKQVLEHEDWIKVIGSSGSRQDILQMTKTLAPHVVVLDFDLADDALETGRKILEASPDAKIIVLSVYDYVGRVAVQPEASRKGAGIDSVEWLSKNSSPAALIKSISEVKKLTRIH